MPSTKKPPRGRPTESELEKRKKRVLKVAEKLFMKRGYSGTSVADISRLAKVSPRMISSHFGDKSELFTAVINERSSQAFSTTYRTIDSDSLEDILFGAAKFAWTIAYRPEAIEFQRLLVGEGSRFINRTSKIAHDAADHFFTEMKEIFQSLIDRGLIGQGDTEKLSKYFVDLVVGFSLIQAGMGYWDRVPDEDELREKVHFFCHSISFFSEQNEQ